MDDLFPEDPYLARTRSHLELIREHGLDPVIAHLDAEPQIATTLAAWIATETSSESADYRDAKRAVLQTPTAHAHLQSQQADRTALAHLAILDLDAALGLQTTYEIVTDPTTAAEHAERAIAGADLERLQLILLACPGLAAQPVSGNLTLAVLHHATSNTYAAGKHARAAAEHATRSGAERSPSTSAATSTQATRQTNRSRS
jgi:hypothetical protein